MIVIENKKKIKKKKKKKKKIKFIYNIKSTKIRTLFPGPWKRNSLYQVY